MVSPFLTAFCVCVFAYHIIGNFREIEVSRFFAAFFLRRKFKAAENGRRFCLLQERLTISPSRNKLVFAKFRLTKSRIN